MSMLLVTALGEEHGLIRKLANSVKESKGTPERKSEIEKQRKDDARIVRARYNNRKNQISGKFEKAYVRHPGDPIQVWKFLTGYEYDIPMGLINEVNSSGRPIRDKDEKPNEGAKDPRGLDIEHEFIPTKW